MSMRVCVCVCGGGVEGDGWEPSSSLSMVIRASL